jgi:hypothetical protein
VSEIDALVERLRHAYAIADRSSPGEFSFVSQVASVNGDCVCALVLSRDASDARQAAAKAIAG